MRSSIFDNKDKFVNGNSTRGTPLIDITRAKHSWCRYDAERPGLKDDTENCWSSIRNFTVEEMISILYDRYNGLEDFTIVSLKHIAFWSP